jgi:hypothetical protein
MDPWVGELQDARSGNVSAAHHHSGQLPSRRRSGVVARNGPLRMICYS